MKKSNLKTIKSKGVQINLGEKEYILKFDLNAFAELEDLEGNINEVLVKVEKGSVKSIRSLIWAGLQGNDNPPTLKEVGSNIDLGDIETLSNKITEALGVALPDSQDNNDPN
jgi:hypothetical protein